MQQYIDLIQEILVYGHSSIDRTGVGTLSIFGTRMEFNLQDGFPLLGLKRTSLRLVLAELLWFIKGGTNIKELHKDGCHIWDEWADSDGELGPVYGKQWTSWPMHDGSTFNQLDDCVRRLRQNPYDRRIVFSAWNPAYLPLDGLSPNSNAAIGRMALAPCHFAGQFYARPGGHFKKQLSLQVHQRSCDMFLGVPFNIASYAALLHMVAAVVGMEPYRLIWTGGDTHLYKNQLEATAIMRGRSTPPLPRLELTTGQVQLTDFKISDFKLLGYKPHPAIPCPIAV